MSFENAAMTNEITGWSRIVWAGAARLVLWGKLPGKIELAIRRVLQPFLPFSMLFAPLSTCVTLHSWRLTEVIDVAETSIEIAFPYLLVRNEVNPDVELIFGLYQRLDPFTKLQPHLIAVPWCKMYWQDQLRTLISTANLLNANITLIS